MGCSVGHLTSDTPHYEQVPFEVPEGWTWTTLGEICVFLSRGKSPKYNDTERLYPVFAQKCNLKDGGISLEQARFLDSSSLAKWTDEYKLRNGDVLINSTGTGTVGRTRLFHESCLGNYPFVVPDSHVTVVRSASEVDSNFVLAYLTSAQIQQYIEDNLAGSTNQKELYIGVLESLQFPLPPVSEQKRIVNKIQELDVFITAIDSSKGELAVTIQNAKSKILDLAIHGKLVPQDPADEPAIDLLRRINPKFTPCDNAQYGNKLYELCHNWEWCTLSDVTTEIRNGAQIKQDKSGNGLPITRIETISQGVIDRNRMGYANIVDSSKYHDYLLENGHILMSHINSAIHVGKCALCDDIANGEEIIHGMNLLCLKPVKEILPKYLLLYFRSSQFYTFIQPYIKNAVNQASINIRNLSSTPIALPPIAEQQHIVTRIEEMFATLDSIQESLA